MAFGTKYRVQFEDVAGVAWDILIKQDPWAGAVTSLTPGNNPLTIRWNGRDKYQTIQGSTADIQVVWESAVDSLYEDSETSQAIYVEVQRATVITWQGFVLPGQYHREFNRPKHYCTITCSDELGALKEIKSEDDSGDPYFYQQKEIAILADVLQETGQTAFIYDGINIFEDTFNTAATDGPLDQTYFYPEKFWDSLTDTRGTCHEILEDILKKYGAILRQHLGDWYILRPNSFAADSVAYRVYSSGGTYASNNSLTTYNDIGSTMYYIHGDAVMTKMQGVGRCEVTLDPPRRVNLIKNGSFDSFTWDGSDFYYWTATNAPNSYGSDDNQLKMGSSEGGALDAYIETQAYVWKASGIRLSFDFTPTYTGSPTNASINLVIKSGTDYLSNVGDAAYWTTSGYWTYDATTVTSGDTEHISIDFPDLNDYVAFYNIMSLNIRIYEFNNENAKETNYMHINNMKLEVDFDDADTKVYAVDNAISINHQLNLTIGSGDTWLDEDYASAHDDEFFVTTTAVGRTNETDTWFIDGDGPTEGTGLPIAHILAKQMVEGYTRSIDKIRCTLRSSLTDIPISVFRDANIVDYKGYVKSFWPVTLELNAQRSEWSGEWWEVPLTYNSDSAEWASEDFNDATITGNSLEINNSAGDDYANFDSYTAVNGEILRYVITLTDDGSSDLPSIEIDGDAQTVAWGVNYITYICDSAGAKQLVLGNDDFGDNFNLTCEIDFYYMTGI